MSSGFDYTRLSADEAEYAQNTTATLKSLIRKTAAAVIEIGQHLLDVKEVLGHGMFSEWPAAEFEWSIRAARRYMRIAKRFGDKTANLADLNLSIQVLDLLSSPSVDDETAETALAIARETGGLTFTDAQSLLQRYPEPDNSPYIILDPREDDGGYNVLRVPRSDDMPDSAYIVYDEVDEFPDNPEDYEEYESALPISRVTLERNITTTQETQRFVAEFDPRPKQLPLPLHLQNPIRVDPLMVYHKPHYIEQALDKLHELYRLATGRAYAPKEPVR